MTFGAITGMNFKTLLTVSGLAIALAAPAYAGKRNPAPIIYAGQGAQPASTGQHDTPPEANYQAASNAAPGSRIEFRYPDQPETFYSANGARTEASAAPLSFSSSDSAVSAAEARQYASARLPDHSTPRAARDPAITMGGFDARAAASQVAADRAAVARVERPADSAANIQQAALSPPSQRPVLPSASAMMATAQPLTTTDSLPYQPVAQPGYDEIGFASVFDPAFAGQPTANGEILDMHGMMAAHQTLPLPSLVQVINQDNGREVVVRVNDRGPFEDNRLIEVSSYAAQMLGFEAGKAPRVRIRYLGPGPVIANVQSAPQMPVTPAVYAPPANDVRAPIVAVSALPPRLPVADPAPVSSSAASGHYFIQAGSFSDIANAQRLHTSLTASYDVDIVPVRVRGADFFRVMIGPFSGRDAAQNLRDRLAYQGTANGLVVTRH